MDLAPVIASGLSVLASGAVGAIAWGVKAELTTLRTEMKLGLAQAEINFFERVNGTYVRTKVHDEAVKRIDADIVRLENRVENLD